VLSEHIRFSPPQPGKSEEDGRSSIDLNPRKGAENAYVIKRKNAKGSRKGTSNLMTPSSVGDRRTLGMTTGSGHYEKSHDTGVAIAAPKMLQEPMWEYISV